MYLKIKIAPKAIYENAAVCPANFLDERPIGPPNTYDCKDKSWHAHMSEPLVHTLEQHADVVMEHFENELFHKMHFEHVVDHRGKSPYRNRGSSLKLRQQDATELGRPNGKNWSYT